MTNPTIERLARVLGDAIDTEISAVEYCGESYEIDGEIYRDVDGSIPLKTIVRAILTELRSDMNHGSLWREWIDHILESK